MINSSLLNSNLLLDCYKVGIFPMANSREDKEIFFVDPEERGIIPLDKLHISKSLKKFMKNMKYEVSFNKSFMQVIKNCADPLLSRGETWISHDIERLYCELHNKGKAHSIEVWENENLVGGIYGMAIGGAFFGESMFSNKVNASKVALVKLVGQLNNKNFILLDTQFMTKHLQTMGGIEINRGNYQDLLNIALNISTEFI
ncbi:MAG: leucyl/phenylalanyl-tRNA--protein transferase [Hellea sp.]|nr:leucyl/phenylalanyl-tRNA--protein transferase [Hellea sp.]